MDNTAAPGERDGGAAGDQDGQAVNRAHITRTAVELQPVEFWQRKNRWRRLPFIRAIYASPYGVTPHLLDVDRNIIAYADRRRGSWQPASGESVVGCTPDLDNWDIVWRGPWPWLRVDRRRDDGLYPSDDVVRDLLERCAANRATAWLLEAVR